jgi:Toastrack DUF4097
MNTRLTPLEHAIGPDGLVVVRLASGDIRVRGIPGDIVQVRAEDPDSLAALDISRGEHSIEIEAGRRSGAVDGRAGSGASVDLDIDVPIAASVVIDVASADIQASDLVGDQRYRSSSGDLRIHSVAGRVTAEAMSGDIEITTSGPGAFDLRTVSGDLRLRADSVTMLRATTTSGDLEVQATIDGDGPFLIQSVSGDIALDPSGDAFVEVRTITGDVIGGAGRSDGERGLRSIQIGSGGPTVDVHSTSGDIVVSPRTPPREGSVQAAVSPEPSQTALPDDLARLEILRAVERGELGIDAARERLEALDPADPDDPTEAGDAEELHRAR